MNVPFLDLKATYLELKPELDSAYHRVMNSGWYLMGEELDAFEQEFAAYCGAKYCVGVGNGLDALNLILRAYDIGPGDEVIVPAHTFIASWLAVSHVGATPVPVDVEPQYYGIDPSLIEAAITPQTKAIMPVHLYGHPADMEPIRKIAKSHGLKVVEDAAQAHGASDRGGKCGTLGDAAAFSFYPGKNLGGFSDAGAIVTNDEVIYTKTKMLRNYGSAVKYQHDLSGVNSRIDELTAAVLRIKLQYMNEWSGRRASIASRYLSELSEVANLKLPSLQEGATPSWHLFVIRSTDRDRLQQDLSTVGVQTLIHYPIPPHLTGAYQAMGYAVGAFPVAEEMCNQVLSLPIGPHLDADAVAEVIQQLKLEA
jgi:dTDP-4-amino-4,6-dideoxygalactose transaminase